MLAFFDNVWNAGISKSRGIYAVKKKAFVFSFLKKDLMLYAVLSNIVTPFIVSSFLYM